MGLCPKAWLADVTKDYLFTSLASLEVCWTYCRVEGPHGKALFESVFKSCKGTAPKWTGIKCDFFLSSAGLWSNSAWGKGWKDFLQQILRTSLWHWWENVQKWMWLVFSCHVSRRRDFSNPGPSTIPECLLQHSVCFDTSWLTIKCVLGALLLSKHRSKCLRLIWWQLIKIYNFPESPIPFLPYHQNVWGVINAIILEVASKRKGAHRELSCRWQRAVSLQGNNKQCLVLPLQEIFKLRHSKLSRRMPKACPWSGKRHATAGLGKHQSFPFPSWNSPVGTSQLVEGPETGSRNGEWKMCTSGQSVTSFCRALQE